MAFQKVFVLNPSQSRRLIAKGVVKLPQMQLALKSGKILVSRGSTDAYILDEIYKELGIADTFNKADYCMGQIVPGKHFMEWGVNRGKMMPEILIENGKPREVKDRVKDIYEFKRGDIVIKGGNAIDINGIPAVLVGAIAGGGTIGALIGTIIAKGIEMICPIGLEKLIFADINDLYPIMGFENMEVPSEGMRCGIMGMPFATKITEIEALEALFDCEVSHIASGGVGGAEGSVSLLISCYDEQDFNNVQEFMFEIGKEPRYVPNTKKD